MTNNCWIYNDMGELFSNLTDQFQNLLLDVWVGVIQPGEELRSRNLISEKFFRSGKRPGFSHLRNNILPRRRGSVAEPFAQHLLQYSTILHKQAKQAEGGCDVFIITSRVSLPSLRNTVRNLCFSFAHVLTWRIRCESKKQKPEVSLASENIVLEDPLPCVLPYPNN